MPIPTKIFSLLVLTFWLLGCGGGELSPRWIERLEVVVPATELFLGESIPLTARATYNDAKVEDVTQTAVWTIDNVEVGELTGVTLKAAKVGTVIVSATLDSRIRNVTIDVITPPDAIEIDESTQFLRENALMTLTASTVVKDQKKTITDNLVWRSSNENIVTVNAEGILQGRQFGSAAITVSRGNLTSKSFLVQVYSDIQKLEIQLEQRKLYVDDTVFPQAVATFSDGHTEDVTYRVTWRSADVNYAIVNKGGALFAAREGKTKIGASLFEKVAIIDIEIAPKLLPFVEVDVLNKIVLRWHSTTPKSYNIYWGETPGIDATATKISDVNYQSSSKDRRTGEFTYVYRYAFERLEARKRYYFRLSVNETTDDGQIVESAMGRELAVVVRENRWELVPGTLVPPVNSTSAAEGSSIYVIGGETPPAEEGKPPTAMATVNKYQYDNNEIRHVATTTLNVARSAAAAVAVGNDIYVIGGRLYSQGENDTSVKNVDMASVEVYRAGVEQWEILPSMPTARSFLVAEAVGDTIYAIGGEGSSQTIEAFNTITGEWSSLANPPLPIVKAASATDNGMIYIFGADTGRAALRYNPAVNYWQALPSSQHVHVRASARALNGKFYVFGGSENTVVPLVDVFDTGLEYWLTAPQMIEAYPIVHVQRLNDTLIAFFGGSDKTVDSGRVYAFK